jgi:hypothetical protein
MPTDSSDEAAAAGWTSSIVVVGDCAIAKEDPSTLSSSLASLLGVAGQGITAMMKGSHPFTGTAPPSCVPNPCATTFEFHGSQSSLTSAMVDPVLQSNAASIFGHSTDGSNTALVVCSTSTSDNDASPTAPPAVPASTPAASPEDAPNSSTPSTVTSTPSPTGSESQAEDTITSTPFDPKAAWTVSGDHPVHH